MSNYDHERLSILRLHFRLRLDMNHVEIAEMLRLQSEEYLEQGVIRAAPSAPGPGHSAESAMPPSQIPPPPPRPRLEA